MHADAFRLLLIVIIDVVFFSRCYSFCFCCSWCRFSNHFKQWARRWAWANESSIIRLVEYNSLTAAQAMLISFISLTLSLTYSLSLSLSFVFSISFFLSLFFFFIFFCIFSLILFSYFLSLIYEKYSDEAIRTLRSCLQILFLLLKYECISIYIERRIQRWNEPTLINSSNKDYIYISNLYNLDTNNSTLFD